MKLTVFGATGGTGRAVVEQALGRGHVVTAVVRTPAAFTLRHALLTVAKGDVLAAQTITEAVRGADAVLSVIGTHGNKKTRLYSDGTANILGVMRDTGVKRLICTSSAGVEPQDPSFGFVYGQIIRRFVLNNVYADARRMEEVVRASDREWTIVRPPQLTDKPGRGSYRTSTGKLPPKGTQLARADLAHLILECAEDGRYVRQHIAAAY